MWCYKIICLESAPFGQHMNFELNGLMPNECNPYNSLLLLDCFIFVDIVILAQFETILWFIDSGMLRLV